METDVDLGKISIVPKGDWNDQEKVEYNDIWRYNSAKYLAIKESQGVIPSDDKVYWYELSSQGKSAYQQAVEDGFTGSEAEWLQSLKQPAIDAATQATAAVERIDERFPQKMDEIKSELSERISQEFNNLMDSLIIAEDLDASLALDLILLNNRDLTTNNANISVRFDFTGTPTHYMLSESSSFTGATWIPFANPSSFTLSGGEGEKTVYAKIKNATDESGVVSSSIRFTTTSEVTLSSISINNGAQSTNSRDVNVVFSYTGVPNKYMISESPDFIGATWIPFSSNNVVFTLSSAEGLKTVYAKMANDSSESTVVSSTITYSTAVTLQLNSISINNGASSTTNQLVDVGFQYAGTPTHYMLSESSSFAGASWIAFNNPAPFTLSTGSGSKTIYAKIKNATEESNVKSGIISYAPPVSENIVFTDPEFKRVMVGLYDTSGNGEVSYTEAAVTKLIGSAFFNNTLVANASELKYFINTTPNFNGVFKGCPNLVSIEYPDDWKLGSGEHDGNIKLDSVKLPANLTTIPATAFQNCASLGTILIPNGVTTIAITAFIGSGLVNITIPNSTTNIGDLGKNCASLVFADLGTGVTTIGNSAFVGSQLATLICRSITPPSMAYAALNGTTPQIYVPDESVAAYKASTPWWSAHAARIHPLSEYPG